MVRLESSLNTRHVCKNEPVLPHTVKLTACRTIAMSDSWLSDCRHVGMLTCRSIAKSEYALSDYCHVGPKHIVKWLANSLSDYCYVGCWLSDSRHVLMLARRSIAKWDKWLWDYRAHSQKGGKLQWQTSIRTLTVADLVQSRNVSYSLKETSAKGVQAKYFKQVFSLAKDEEESYWTKKQTSKETNNNSL